MGSSWSDDRKHIGALNQRIEQIWNQKGIQVTQQSGEVGSNFNGWRKPISKFGPNEGHLAQLLRQNDYIGKYDISNESWQKCCGVVDEITRSFSYILDTITAKHHPSLKFGDFVHQGSSREGLKIREPNEFDMILPFYIEGIQTETEPACSSDGEPIPALIKLVLPSDVVENTKYQSLINHGVFDCRDSVLFFNAECFQTRVINSLMDLTISEIQKAIDTESRQHPCSFNLTKTSVFPPTYRFKIVINSDDDFDEFSYGRSAFRGLRCDVPQAATGDQSASRPCWNSREKVIEFDVVPGLLIGTDAVPNPNSSWNFSMACDRYAVMKWVHKGRHAAEYSDPGLIWRESSACYEKHIIDVGSRDQHHVYILTACRIMKAYIDGLGSDAQLGSLLTSHHIKNIAIHCILLQVQASGVKESLGYFLAMLEISLELGFLPHYFYGNPNMTTMFPNCKATIIRSQRLNLFKYVLQDHFVQAKLEFRKMEANLNGLFTECHSLGNHQCLESFRQLCSLKTENTSSCAVM